jgi:hypothetical protein
LVEKETAADASPRPQATSLGVSNLAALAAAAVDAAIVGGLRRSYVGASGYSERQEGEHQEREVAAGHT